MFGDWNLKEAVFNSGTSIDVEPNISLSNGPSIKPPCVASVPGGVRGETNSLTLLRERHRVHLLQREQQQEVAKRRPRFARER